MLTDADKIGDAFAGHAVGDQAAVSGRVFGMKAEDGHFSPLVKRGQQPADGFGPDQRGIAEHHQGIAFVGCDGGARGEHGIGSAALVVLDINAGSRCAAMAFIGDIGHAGADHNGGRGTPTGLRCREHMAQHRQSTDGVEHLGELGFHPGPLACGEDDGQKRFIGSVGHTICHSFQLYLDRGVVFPCALGRRLQHCTRAVLGRLRR